MPLFNTPFKVKAEIVAKCLNIQHIQIENSHPLIIDYSVVSPCLMAWPGITVSCPVLQVHFNWLVYKVVVFSWKCFFTLKFLVWTFCYKDCQYLTDTKCIAAFPTADGSTVLIKGYYMDELTSSVSTYDSPWYYCTQATS